MKQWERDLIESLRRRAMRLGDRGLQVKRWQSRLRSKGFAVEVDGHFGPKTRNATMVAQEWAGLGATGNVGVATWTQVGKKKRDSHPLTTALSILGRPKIIDARKARNGFPQHVSRFWAGRGIPTLIVGHHSGGPASFLADARFHVQSSYLSAGGAPAIAYHLGVDIDGAIFVFNEFHDLTWHCRGANTQGLGIVIRGNRDAEDLPLAQRRSLDWLIRQIMAGTFQPFEREDRWPRITVGTTHRHVNASTCPGRHGESAYRATLGAGWRFGV